MNRPIRLLIADDHQDVRHALVSFFEVFEDFEIVEQAKDGSEAVELAERLRPNVVLIDYDMPRMDGIEAARQILAAHPRARIIGLSVYAEEVGKRLVDAGAMICLAKVADPAMLLETVRLAAAAKR